MRTRSFTLMVATAVAAWVMAPAIAVPDLVPDDPVPPAESGARSATVGGSAAAEGLVGLFEIRKGECGSGSGQGVTAGSYFRMIQRNGTQAGPFVPNSDSPCGDKTFTPLVPGTDKGLSTTGYQPHPNPAFDGTGNGANSKIAQPAKWFNIGFSIATNEKDPQTNKLVPVPSLSHDGSGNLSGNIAAFAAAWNGGHFNQGSPKPDGQKPGLTSGPTGTYNAATNAFVIEWTSQIIDPDPTKPSGFDGFTGKWRLEGTFKLGATPPGVQAPRVQSANTSRQRGSGLASTGPEVPAALGAVLVSLGGAGMMLDAFLGRRRRKSRKI